MKTNATNGSNYLKLDLHLVRLEVDRLLSTFPELAEDDILRLDMLEAKTGLFELLRQIEQKRQEAFGQSVALEMIVKLWNERKARFERRDEAFRKLMFALMEHAAVKKLELPEATLFVRAGVQSVLVTDESIIPKEFCRIRVEPDKKMIKAALVLGEPVPGAELSNAEPSLSIRIK